MADESSHSWSEAWEQIDRKNSLQTIQNGPLSNGCKSYGLMKVNIALDSTVHLFNQHTSVKKKRTKLPFIIEQNGILYLLWMSYEHINWYIITRKRHLHQLIISLEENLLWISSNNKCFELCPQLTSNIVLRCHSTHWTDSDSLSWFECVLSKMNEK